MKKMIYVLMFLVMVSFVNAGSSYYREFDGVNYSVSLIDEGEKVPVLLNYSSFSHDIFVDSCVTVKNGYDGFRYCAYDMSSYPDIGMKVPVLCQIRSNISLCHFKQGDEFHIIGYKDLEDVYQLVLRTNASFFGNNSFVWTYNDSCDFILRTNWYSGKGVNWSASKCQGMDSVVFGDVSYFLNISEKPVVEEVVVVEVVDSGNGGGDDSDPVESFCNSSWDCTYWTKCARNGSHYRFCSDVNGCNSTKLIEWESCVYVEKVVFVSPSTAPDEFIIFSPVEEVLDEIVEVEEVEEEEELDDKSYFAYWLVGILALVLFVIIIYSWIFVYSRRVSR